MAPELLGARLTHVTPDGSVTVRLTEVEAYQGQGEDPGSHAFRGVTPRTAVMFGPAGHLYAYFTYGMHTCANVVCLAAPQAAGVLLRGGEVVDGLELARARRSGVPGRAPVPDRDLARGPARLAVALGIALGQSGADLLSGAFALDPAPQPPAAATGPRTGVAGDGGGDAFPWRFWIPGDPTVSPYRRAVRRVRSG